MNSEERRSSSQYNSLHGSRRKDLHQHFTVYNDSIVLDDETTDKLLQRAHRRMIKSNIALYFERSTISAKKMEEIAHSQIDLGKMLGHGSFSSVFAINRVHSKDKDYDAQSLVIKVLKPKLATKPKLLAACAADLVTEGHLLSTLSHKNIISIEATSPMGICSFANGRHDAFFLMMERLEETLDKKIVHWKSARSRSLFRKSKISGLLEEQVSVLIQLGQAIQHLHSQRILYRDAKPSNIGFTKDGTLKIFDFDVARILPDSDDPNGLYHLSRRTGSPRYMAPEIAKGEPYNLKADVYAYALICYEVMSLKKPYDDIGSSKYDQAVFFDGVRPEIPKSWPRGFGDLLRESWSADICSRPTLEEALRKLQTECTIMLAPKSNSKRKLFNIRLPKTVPVLV